MSTFTLEIAGKPIACICAADLKTAEELIYEPWFCTNLVSFHFEGRPLWDGRSAKRLRKASLAEEAIVSERLHASDLDHKELDEDDPVFYLVPVSEMP